MNLFTAAYLARLEVWGLAAACLQGALVMLSWFGWERATRHATAEIRHRLACLHFAALVLSPMLIVAVLHWTVSRMGVAPPHGSPADELPRQLAGYRMFLALALPLAALWMAGVAAMWLRLARDAWQLRRLRRHPAPAGLLRTVHRLAVERMGMAVPAVRLAEIDSPQVVGLWRPAIVVPAGLLRLSPAEQEALLLHELAHAQRHDFRWNLLQRIALAAFWFHPAAWLLYRRVMREREMRCDALRVPFDKALVKGAPDFGVGRHLSPEQELQLYHHYGLQVPPPDAEGPGQDAPGFGRLANDGHDDTVMALLIALITTITEDPVNFEELYGYGRLARDQRVPQQDPMSAVALEAMSESYGEIA